MHENEAKLNRCKKLLARLQRCMTPTMQLCWQAAWRLFMRCSGLF